MLHFAPFFSGMISPFLSWLLHLIFLNCHLPYKTQHYHCYTHISVLFKKNSLLFYVCLHVFICTTYVAYVYESLERYQISWDCSSGELWAVRMSGIKQESFVRVASSLNCWTISLAYTIDFLITMILLRLNDQLGFFSRHLVLSNEKEA